MQRAAPVLVLAFALAASAAFAASEESIAPAELLRAIEAGTAPVVVDVRSEAEFAEGHVPGAIHLPFLQAASRVDEIPGPPDAPVVVYCEHGPRARFARWRLGRAGRTDVVMLEGHMSAWREAGLPIERPEAAAEP